MSTETSPSGGDSGDIDKKQSELDAADGELDGSVDGSTESIEKQRAADREKLTATYIHRVNDLQSKIAELRREIDVQKDMRSESWQGLEKTCKLVEQGLYERLQAIDPAGMQSAADAFDAAVCSLVDLVPSLSGGKDTAAETRESPDLRASIEGNVRALGRLPEQVYEQLFGCAPATPADVEMIVKELSAGTENSPHAYLLDDPMALVRMAHQVALDKSGRVASEIRAMRDQEESLIKQITDETAAADYGLFEGLTSKQLEMLVTGTLNSASLLIPRKKDSTKSAIENESADIQLVVDRIKTIRKDIEPLKAQQEALDGLGAQIDVTLRIGDAERARSNGDEDAANRHMTKLLELHGANLADMDPTLAAQVQTAAETLRDQGKLSETEQALLFSNPNSPDALAQAIEAKVDSDAASNVDILDQLRACETFRVGKFKSFEERFRGLGMVTFQGRDVQPALKNGSYVKLENMRGSTLEILASPQAQKKLEHIPEGMQPVLLKPIESMRLKTITSRGARTELQNQVYNFYVQDTDLGFVDEAGNVFQNDGKTPVDMETHEHRGIIESQLTDQRGFRTETYKPKLDLRTMDNKPYPYALRTIKTQSGVNVEGVTVEEGVLLLLNATPPNGKTLVLKRIPRSIMLRTPEYDATKGQSRGTTERPHQKVLFVDMVEKKDLAYASLDEGELVSTNLDGKDERRTSAEGLEKGQEETTRDIQRVLDKNPAIHGVKRTASTVQQTVTHLQGFLSAAQTGSARDSFAKFAREEAKPTLDILRNSETKQQVDEARRMLTQMKEVNGVALGGLEKTIDDQIRALDQFTAMLADGRTLRLFETITDESKFAADTWENFAKNELPIIIASIVGACIAVAIVVGSMGTATPLLAVAAASALGGVISAEIGKEAVFRYHQYFDEDVQSGRKTFTARSRIGSFAAGEQKFNEATGQKEDQNLFTDVVNPLTQEFALAFGTTLLTMGVGQAGGNALSKLLQNPKVIEKLASKSDILKVVARRLTAMNANKEALSKATNMKEAFNRILKTIPREVGEEMSDEVQEEFLTRALNQLDLAIATNDALDGKVGMGTVAAMMLAVVKGTRIGSKTVSYSVEGDASSMKARCDAVRAELEARGAEVTDLGKGYLSVQYELKGEDGSTTWEVVQMRPKITEKTAESPSENEPQNLFNEHLAAFNEFVNGPWGTLKAGSVGEFHGIKYTVQFNLGKQQAVLGATFEFPGGKIVQAVLRPTRLSDFTENYQTKPALQDIYPAVYADITMSEGKHILIVQRVEGPSEHENGNEFLDIVKTEEGSRQLVNDMYLQFDTLFSSGISLSDVAPAFGHNVIYNGETKKFQLFDVGTVQISHGDHAYKFLEILDRVDSQNSNEATFVMRMIQKYDQEHPGVLEKPTMSDPRQSMYILSESGRPKFQTTMEIIEPGTKEFEYAYSDHFGRLPGPNVRCCFLKQMGSNQLSLDPAVLEACRKGDVAAFTQLLKDKTGRLGAEEFVPVSKEVSKEWMTTALDLARKTFAGEGNERKTHIEEVKKFMKMYGKSIDNKPEIRLQIAHTLLGRTSPFTEGEKEAILSAHKLPGNIDQLTPAEKMAKGRALLTNQVFDRMDAQLLLDAGIAGHGMVIDDDIALMGDPVPRPRPNSPVRPPLPAPRPAPDRRARPAPSENVQDDFILKPSEDGVPPMDQPWKVPNPNDGPSMEGWIPVEKQARLPIFRNAAGKEMAALPRQEEALRQRGFTFVRYEPGYIVQGSSGIKAVTTREVIAANAEPSGPPAQDRNRPAPQEQRQAPSPKPSDPLTNPPWPNQVFKPGDEVSVSVNGETKRALVSADQGDQVVVLVDGGPTKFMQKVTVSKADLVKANTPTTPRQPFRVGEEVYVMRTNGVVEKGWKIVQGEKEIMLSNGTLQRPFNPAECFHAAELEYGHLPRNIALSEQARIIQKKYEKVRQFQTLSEEEFTTLFSGEVQQGSSGNCYLVAAMASLRQSPHFKEIIQTSVKKVPGGYEISLPLGTDFTSQRKIFVRDADMRAVQKVRKKDPQTGQMVDRQLRGLQGADGWLALEAAFIIDKFGTLDRAAAEGGFGDEALGNLMGNGVNNASITPQNVSGSLKSTNPEYVSQVVQWLNTFSTGKDIATANTQRAPDNNPQ